MKKKRKKKIDNENHDKHTQNHKQTHDVVFWCSDNNHYIFYFQMKENDLFVKHL